MMRRTMKAMVLAAAVASMAACDRAETASHGFPASGTSAAASPVPSAIKIVADEHGYTPSTVSVAKGFPITLRFIRTTDKTCATQVVFPELNVNKPLPLNTPVDIAVPAGDARTYAFACGMGMHRGTLVVQ